VFHSDALASNKSDRTTFRLQLVRSVTEAMKQSSEEHPTHGSDPGSQTMRGLRVVGRQSLRHSRRFFSGVVVGNRRNRNIGYERGNSSKGNRCRIRSCSPTVRMDTVSPCSSSKAWFAAVGHRRQCDAHQARST
jgi:hypothetical protein